MRIYRGLTLVELVLSMVIVAISLTGITLSMQAMGLGAYNSSDPLMRQQALYIAEAQMNELMYGYTFTQLTQCGYSASMSTNGGPGCSWNSVYSFYTEPATQWSKWSTYTNLSAYTVGVYINAGAGGYNLFSGLATTSTAVLMAVTVTWGTNQSVQLLAYRTSAY